MAPLREQLLSHPVYPSLRDFESVRIFMKFHVFAVWDFMSLVKTLQRQLTCIETPWLPPKNIRAARFINEIVLAEETDDIGEGVVLSHFELYLRAMNELGADTQPVLKLVQLVQRESPDLRSFSSEGGVWSFLANTFTVVGQQPHQVAAAFLYGREDIIPAMFARILNEVSEERELTYFRKYLERHIQMDGDCHAPLARKMLAELCGEDEVKWQESLVAAEASIRARIDLWTFIKTQLDSSAVLERNL